MRNISIVITLVCVILFLYACKKNIQAGQVWIISYYVDDPFRQTEIDTIYILDVKREYIKYRIGDRISSSHISILKYDAKLISNGN